MARRYDSRTTTFSPEGRLFQVEYAMEAINNAGSTIGVLTTEGVILAGEKKITSKLLDNAQCSEKLYRVDDHIVCAVAGITSDANILINKLRLGAQQYTFTYGEPIPIEQMIVQICDIKQGYTQYGGLRPFGVSFLFAGHDDHFGFQLYHTDPSGNYSGWKATAIGTSNQTATTMLRQQWKEDMNMADGLMLTAKCLLKTLDTANPSSDTLEFGVLSKGPDGKATYRNLTADEVTKLLKAAQPEEGAKAA